MLRVQDTLACTGGWPVGGCDWSQQGLWAVLLWKAMQPSSVYNCPGLLALVCLHTGHALLRVGSGWLHMSKEVLQQRCKHAQVSAWKIVSGSHSLV